MEKQYKVQIIVDMVVTVDEDKDDLDHVLNEMDYEFTEPDDNSDIVTTEFVDYTVLDERENTILV